MPRPALLAASLFLAFGLVALTAPADIAAQDGGYAPDGEEWAFVDLLNGYRGSVGLAPVTLNYELGAAADYHSYDMATNNYFAHYALDGTDPGTNLANFGYTGYPYSENIAGGMATAQEVLVAWQNSPEHNGTMTDPRYTEVGVGRYYAEGSAYGWYWTATYGGGEGAAPAPEVVAAPVEAVPLVEEVAPAPEWTAPVEGPVTTNVVTEIALDPMTTTVYEPPTVVTSDGAVVEMPQNIVDADGDRAYSTGGNPVANGTGDTVIYGDINTGGVTGESIVYEPPALSVTGGPAPAPAPVTTTTTITTAPPPAAPIVTDPTLTETTTTNISMEDGNGRALG
jgi:hypothetical protein